MKGELGIIGNRNARKARKWRGVIYVQDLCSNFFYQKFCDASGKLSVGISEAGSNQIRIQIDAFRGRAARGEGLLAASFFEKK